MLSHQIEQFYGEMKKLIVTDLHEVPYDGEDDYFFELIIDIIIGDLVVEYD